MIAFLRGRVIYSDVEKSLVILDVNGVGYEIFLPLASAYFHTDNAKHPALNPFSVSEGTSLFIYTYVREDRITLYGFFTIAQREIFSLLLDVKDIGPKLAVNILSNIDAHQFINFIITNDIAGLSSIKGVGKATSERMVMELKNKIIKKMSVFKDIMAASLDHDRAKSCLNESNNNNKPDFEGEEISLSNTQNNGEGNNAGRFSNHEHNEALLNKNKININIAAESSAVIFETALALEFLGYSRLESIELAGKVYMANKDNENVIKSDFLTKECLKYIYSLKN